MLVLSRKLNQTIVIDGQIEIEVLKCKGNTVRLGIRAPQNIKVLRGELSPFEIEAKDNSQMKAESEPSQPIELTQDEDNTQTFVIAHAV